MSLTEVGNANDKSPATGETAGQRQGRNHHEILNDYREAGHAYCGRGSPKSIRATQRLFAETGAVLTRSGSKSLTVVRQNKSVQRSIKRGVRQGRVPPYLQAQRFPAAGRRATRRVVPVLLSSRSRRFAAALYLRPLASSGRLSVVSLTHSAALPSYRPPLQAVPMKFLPKERRSRNVANVAPVAAIRPRGGGVMVSVEALYKMAQIAFDLGKMEEAAALFAIAKDAADADERALIRPYGTGGPASS